MTPLETALQKLRDQEGYGEQDRDVTLTGAERSALMDAATTVMHMASALGQPLR